MKKTVVMSLLVAGTMLGGCGMSEDEFQEQYFDAYCNLALECQSKVVMFESVEDCVTLMTAFMTMMPEGCEYDGGGAKACIDWAEAATCETMNSAEASVCEDVYVGDACESSDTGSANN